MFGLLGPNGAGKTTVINGFVTGTAHRDRCGQRRTITVRIRQDIAWLPDGRVPGRPG